MANKKILIGASLRQDPLVLGFYFKSLAQLKVPKHHEVQFAFVDDSDEGVDFSFWNDQDQYPVVLAGDDRRADATYVIGNITHEWQISTFDHLAKQKQKIIEYAQKEHFDYVLFVDSDLILDPNTLLSLHSLDVGIANAIFWTSWHKDSTPLPQCWLRHPYVLSGLGTEQNSFLSSLINRQIVRVIGGGACTLFKTEVFDFIRYYPRLEGLPKDNMWQGEDRTLAILAQQHHITQFADPWPNIFHAYHPHQRSEETLKQISEVLSAPQQQSADYGDLVSFSILPLEEPELAQQTDPRLTHIRGRLGGIKMAPEIEAALLEMHPGDQRITKIVFPPYSEIPGYAGQEKIYQLTLHDIKPYGYAPVLAQEMFGGLDG